MLKVLKKREQGQEEESLY